MLRWERNLLQCRRPGFDPWVGKTPWRRTWQPTPVFLPGESPWTEESGGLQSKGHKESGTTEWLSTAQHRSDIRREEFGSWIFPGCSGIAPTSLGPSDWPYTLWCRETTASQFLVSGLALWVSQVRAHNKLPLYAISHPYFLKGRQKMGEILTLQREALKSSSFSNKPNIW